MIKIIYNSNNQRLRIIEWEKFPEKIFKTIGCAVILINTQPISLF